MRDPGCGARSESSLPDHGSRIPRPGPAYFTVIVILSDTTGLSCGVCK
jgi:hypothetical protein